MATTKLYLDTRAPLQDGTCPLKLTITHKGRSAHLSLGIKILPSQWRNGSVCNHPLKYELNRSISSMKLSADTHLLSLLSQGQLRSLTVTQIRDLLSLHLQGEASQPVLFLDAFNKYLSSRDTAGTRSVYSQTLRKLTAFDPHLSSRSFEDIDKNYLDRFDRFLSLSARARNARNIHLRNIRAVFNYALNDDLTSAYPFRKFKIRPEATIKKALSVEQLRTLISFDTFPEYAAYRDIFVLMFLLCGINIIDLANLTEITGGRINYRRRKTHKWYSIKVEPEALSLITKHRGHKFLLDIMDRYSNHENYKSHLNAALKKIGPVSVASNGKRTFQPLFPSLSSNWARHTWATIAASLDIPKETIAAALGHSTKTVTDIYIDFDRRKIDIANRRVIDFVFYNK